VFTQSEGIYVVTVVLACKNGAMFTHVIAVDRSRHVKLTWSN
jgi:hypothetical protein